MAVYAMPPKERITLTEEGAQKLRAQKPEPGQRERVKRMVARMNLKDLTKTVYVVSTKWSNPDDEGMEIISVRAKLEDARADMRQNIEQITRIYDSDIWDPDYCIDGDDLVTRGFEGGGAFELPTAYRWEVSRFEVT